MAWINEDILTISGITASTTGQGVSFSNKTNSPVFVAGGFGVSATQLVSGQSWVVQIYTRLGSGQRVKIAQSGDLTSATSEFIPILNAETTAQANFMGIPRPYQIDIQGDSAGVGLTFSGIVSAALLTGD